MRRLLLLEHLRHRVDVWNMAHSVGGDLKRSPPLLPLGIRSFQRLTRPRRSWNLAGIESLLRAVAHCTQALRLLRITKLAHGQLIERGAQLWMALQRILARKRLVLDGLERQCARRSLGQAHHPREGARARWHRRARLGARPALAASGLALNLCNRGICRLQPERTSCFSMASSGGILGA